jgi:Tfp pilus assembly protein PilF
MRAWMLLTGALLILTSCATSGKREAAQQMLDFHYRMGMAYLEDGDFQNGLVEFREGEKIDSKSTKVLFALGHTHFSQGDYGQARLMMKRVIALEPSNGEAQNYLGNILEKQGDKDAALVAFGRAAAIPEYRTPHYALHNKGRIHVARREFAQAEEAFKHAIRRVPAYYPARADLAGLYMETARWAKAVDQWRVYLDLVPDMMDVHYFMGKAYVGLGQLGSARTSLNLFIEQAGVEHPLYPEARALLDDLDNP